ncbi:TVP38/TMEM64 family protein [Prosthecobacter sp.]|uniref:TVP38/TMEM64 family protein n=1 Tax=Prosthecobacter sp. TaxID=1965333 RepID=UPI002ABCEBD9|nr:TVP38/TMEM64 family protein [Prosthecobacter sp.]MDZ4405346.1 TVP38/TMEM64 family protein [Prosthecobacter sp.]
MKKTSKLTLRIMVVLAFVVAVVLFDLGAWLEVAIARVETLGPWGPVVFIVVYVIATVLMLPGSALGLAAGALFGVVYGTGIVSIASTLGAALAFLVGRFLARDAIAARMAGNPAFAALDRALTDDGWKIVALARLSPVFPYTLLNYAFGLTKVRFTHYVLVSWIAMLPGTVLYVYLGSLARVGGRGSEKTPAEWAMYAVGLLATVLVTVIITRMTRRAIREAGLARESAEHTPPTS